MPSEAWFYPDMTIRKVLKLSVDVRKMNCNKEEGMFCGSWATQIGGNLQRYII